MLFPLFWQVDPGRDEPLIEAIVDIMLHSDSSQLQHLNGVTKHDQQYPPETSGGKKVSVLFAKLLI